MRENRNFVVPVNILTPVCARPGLLGPHDTLPFVLIPVWLSADEGLSLHGSDSSSACRRSTVVGVHVGQFDLVSSQVCAHKCDALSWLIDISLVSRSAGLSANGVNDKLTEGKASLIS